MSCVRGLWSVEGEFLLEAVAGFVRSFKTLSVPEGLNWGRLEQLAAANRLMPVVLKMARASDVPPNVIQRWRSLQIGVELHYHRSKTGAGMVCNALQAAGIPSVLTRGMALAEWVYRDPALRPMVDVDVLVPQFARNHVVDALARKGLSLARRLRSQFVYQVSGVTFEIHWSFLTPKRYRGVAEWGRWLDRRVAIPDAPALYRLNASDELIALVLHGFIHHQLDNLQQWMDIAIVSRQDSIDWDYIAGWCVKAGVGRVVWSTLGMVSQSLNLDLQGRSHPLRSEAGTVPESVLLAYLAPAFGEDSIRHFALRRRHLLWAAPTPLLKVAQCLRFLGADELRRLVRVAGCRGGRNHACTPVVGKNSVGQRTGGER